MSDVKDRERLFIERYETLKPLLKTWGSYIKDRVTARLSIDYATVTCRLKEFDSLYGKAFHRGLYNDLQGGSINHEIEKILTAITDKIGVRIVIKDLTRAKLVFESIRDDTYWNTYVTRDINDAILGQPDSFLYTGYHLIIYPKGAGFYKAEDRQNITCEVQIRTQLQDAYASVSHEIVYKKAFQYDIEIRRMFARAIALLEVVDESFKSIYSMASDMNRTIPAYVNDLVSLYRGFNPAFRDEQVDYRVLAKYTDSLKEVPIIQLRAFLNKRERDIRVGIQCNKDYFLFRQPVVLLLAFFASRNQNYLREASDLSSEDFDRLLTGFNIASDIQ